MTVDIKNERKSVRLFFRRDANKKETKAKNKN